MEAWIKAVLEADTDVTDIVNNRMFPARMPRAAGLPYLTYDSAKAEFTHTLYSDCIGQTTFGVRCYATTTEQAFTLADAVAEALRAQGAAQNTNGGVTTGPCQVLSRSQAWSEPLDGSDKFISVVEISAQAWVGA